MFVNSGLYTKDMSSLWLAHSCGPFWRGKFLGMAILERKVVEIASAERGPSRRRDLMLDDFVYSASCERHSLGAHLRFQRPELETATTTASPTAARKAKLTPVTLSLLPRTSSASASPTMASKMAAPVLQANFSQPKAACCRAAGVTKAFHAVRRKNLAGSMSWSTMRASQLTPRA